MEFTKRWDCPTIFSTKFLDILVVIHKATPLNWRHKVLGTVRLYFVKILILIVKDDRLDSKKKILHFV